MVILVQTFWSKSLVCVLFWQIRVRIMSAWSARQFWVEIIRSQSTLVDEGRDGDFLFFCHLFEIGQKWSRHTVKRLKTTVLQTEFSDFKGDESPSTSSNVAIKKYYVITKKRFRKPLDSVVQMIGFGKLEQTTDANIWVQIRDNFLYEMKFWNFGILFSLF